MNVLDLFSGIGGFSLGLERAGMRTVAFCEIEPFCRAVIGKHWPGIPIYGDVRELSSQHLTADGIGVDLICGGFPCQDISIAGRGEGIDGSRSGLWTEFARLIGEIRPGHVIVENVAALLGRGMDKVLGDLAALGYDAEWHCIPASAVGAPHVRDRVWIVANSSGRRGWANAARYGLSAEPAELQPENGQARPDHGAALCGDVGDANAERCGRRQDDEGQAPSERNGPASSGDALADAIGLDRDWWASRIGWRFESAANDPRQCGRGYSEADVQWVVEPNVGRVANGVPHRVDRLRALGNSLVPQIAEIIGRAIMLHEQERQ